MAAQRRANVEDVDPASLQCLLEPVTGARTFETTRETPCRAIIDITDRHDFAADTRDISRVPKAH